jgi:sulfate transport system ATP-binding protein
MSVELRDLTRRFGGMAAVDGITLSIARGEFAALLGPSGSGKTTLLRLLAGLDLPDAGEIRVQGEDLARVPARARRIGVVFQNYALFRHMTVFENVAFGLRVRPRRERPAEAEITRRVTELLELVQIPALARRYPEQISGGQRQRVALARALAIEPQLLLLDEPFGALDAVVRKEVRRWVRGLHERLGLTSILVTHDQEEAMEMADRIAVMNQGRIVQFAAPAELLEAPVSDFVAGFVGESTRLLGEVREGRLHLGLAGLEPLPVPLPDGPARLFLRPSDAWAEPGDGPFLLRGRLGGAEGRALLAQGDVSLEAAAHPALRDRGMPCQVTLRGGWVFSESGARARAG